MASAKRALRGEGGEAFDLMLELLETPEEESQDVMEMPGMCFFEGRRVGVVVGDIVGCGFVMAR